MSSRSRGSSPTTTPRSRGKPAVPSPGSAARRNGMRRPPGWTSATDGGTQPGEPHALALAGLEAEPAHGDERSHHGPDRDRHQVVTLPAVAGARGEAVLERVRDVVE